MVASESAGVALVIWAAGRRSGRRPDEYIGRGQSDPAANEPARTPINQAFPVNPPEPTPNARSPAEGTRLVASTRGWSLSELGRSEAVVDVPCRGEEGVVFMGVASRGLPGAAPGGDYISRATLHR